MSVTIINPTTCVLGDNFLNPKRCGLNLAIENLILQLTEKNWFVCFASVVYLILPFNEACDLCNAITRLVVSMLSMTSHTFSPPSDNAAFSASAKVMLHLSSARTLIYYTCSMLFHWSITRVFRVFICLNPFSATMPSCLYNQLFINS